ncbi:MAG: hypothetical protein ABIN80_04825 [Dyadobacter sp.]|uniref:hypothetical protein n=1 Tax=Dyadobacter sp. TaxID=1914288 RepID=UPI003265B861
MTRIKAYCHLREDFCSVNGQVIAKRDKDSEDGWFKQIYKAQEFAYPKFHKMDGLSQAGFLASELIKRIYPEMVTAYKDDEIAMVFANQSSSADTDLRFQRSYEQNGAPSPSLFVYTLPNIVLGEIAILNKWYGENMFAVLPKFAPDFFVDYSQILMSAGSKAVLGGWIGIMEKQVNVFLFFADDSGQDGLEFSPENLAGLAEM